MISLRRNIPSRPPCVSLPNRASTRTGQHGVSLVELLVALVIGLFLVGGVVAMYVTVSGSSRASTIESQLNEDAALALEILQQQIRLSGFSLTDADGNRLFSGRSVFGCDQGFNKTDDPFASLACKASGTEGGLAIRYHATVLNTQPTGTKPTNCAFEGIDAWIPSAGEGAAAALTLADNRYYVANDTSNENTPTLFCIGRKGDTFGTATALIPGVISMDLRFGVTANTIADAPLPHQITAYLSASDVATLTNTWSRVAAVRICLLVRSTKKVSLEDSKLQAYKDCSGTSQSATDRYLRRAYVTTVFMRNMRPAIPSPYKIDGTTVTDPWAKLTEN